MGILELKFKDKYKGSPREMFCFIMMTFVGVIRADHPLATTKITTSRPPSTQWEIHIPPSVPCVILQSPVQSAGRIETDCWLICHVTTIHRRITAVPG